MVDLIKTGVEGLDEVLNGGIPRNSTTLITGSPGAGKTIFGIQYIYNGVELFDEKGIYLSFEENKEDLRQTAESIGFNNWTQYITENKIRVYDKQELVLENDYHEAMDKLLEHLDSNYDRVVLDSLSMFQLFSESEHEKRTDLLKFTDLLRENGLTTLMVTDQAGVFPDTDIGMEHFVTDNNIFLLQTQTDHGVNRYLWVMKMRKQNIDTDIFPMEIANGGITVHENAQAFSMVSSKDSLF